MPCLMHGVLQLVNAGDAAAECAKHLFAFFRKSIERRLVREHRYVPPPASSMVVDE